MQEVVSPELAGGDFALRDWASNHSASLPYCPPEDRCDLPVVKVLGYVYKAKKYSTI